MKSSTKWLLSFVITAIITGGLFYVAQNYPNSLPNIVSAGETLIILAGILVCARLLIEIFLEDNRRDR